MCLNIKSSFPKNKRKAIRYKFLTTDLQSPYAYKQWEKNIWEGSNCPDEDYASQKGFHTYSSEAIARKAAEQWVRGGIQYVIVKLSVRNLKAKGMIVGCDDYSDGKDGEIWREAKIIHVYKRKITAFVG